MVCACRSVTTCYMGYRKRTEKADSSEEREKRIEAAEDYRLGELDSASCHALRTSG
jgi:hypothetical protein